MNVHDFTVKMPGGKERKLSDFAGGPILIVNTASKCGFTPQYEGLEALHRKYGNKGLTVLGFPCNQFGAQEPGNEAQIMEFCSLTYDVTFPVLGKIEVNGANADPVYKFLKEKAPGILGTEAIKWNFTKFLINQKGDIVKRYPPQVVPQEISQDLESLLKN